MEFNPLFWWKSPNALQARYGPDERVKSEVEKSKQLDLTSHAPVLAGLDTNLLATLLAN